MSTSLRSRFGAVAALAAAALVLSACGTSGDDSANASTDSDTAATTDRTLTVYSGRDGELITPLIEQFEEESGITVKVRYAGTTELAAQILEEGERTPAEVFLSQDAGALGAISEAGLFAPLSDDVTSAVDEAYTSHDGTWVGLTGRARVIAYDSEKYAEEDVPGDIFELTKPEWAGKVGIVPGNASFQAFITAVRENEGEDVARDWLIAMKDNGAQIFAKNGELLDAVNAGSVDLGLVNHYYWARSEQDPTTLRAQLKFGEPGSISALVNVTGVGILTPAAESTEAKEFVEFLVSETAQTYFLEETYEYPLAPGIGDPAGVPALADLGGPDIDLASLASLDATLELLTDVGLL